ncbi:MAG TPA: MerR family transcriptional regulator [Bdellovibrionota bacterium]|jgi:DNA-binding transcriptional MerR regulator|nr:MerR family transcriptional regulator [Bdellovibrionota bacterium]
MAQLGIGELARLLNVSRRTLRYYEEVGIIAPKSRGSNNYRYYDVNDLNRIQAVMMMRKSGLSLKEVLDTLGPASTRAMDFSDGFEFTTGQELALKIKLRLRQQSERLQEKILELQKTKETIDRSLHAIESCLGCVSSVKLEECVDCRTGCSEVVDAATQANARN